ncbi:MAG: SUMF1/EgtB/PvdO family nonheme iron enzyme [Planctomycetota bacterium]|nr:SUMF1/EgtB/PvdO family nonheme iron enzyme [Planctomycetota bacterium]
MAKQSDSVRVLRVFVSSPGDVPNERAAVDGVLKRINAVIGEEHRFLLRPWKWEDDVVPQLGSGPQPVVDSQTPDCEIYLGIMSGRFGTPTGEFGSGTEKEFRDAISLSQQHGRPWVLFYFNESPPLPTTGAAALQYARVVQFREELSTLGIVGKYQTLEQGDASFVHRLQQDLTKLALRMVAREEIEPAAKYDPARYLQRLFSQTAHIEIRGISGGRGEASRFPIEELYITLRTHAGLHGVEYQTRPDKKTPVRPDELAPHSHSVDLRETLAQQRLVVIGDPGAGKTTFLRRLAAGLCRFHLHNDSAALDWLGLTVDPADADQVAGESSVPLPAFVSLAELYEHISASFGKAENAPATRSGAAWLPRFLAAVSRENHLDLDEGFFAGQLQQGRCWILLDGLDEAPDRVSRQSLVELIESFSAAYRNCRLVVTSRPAALADQTVLNDFAHARIEPLDDLAVQTFLTRWCQALYVDSAVEANRHCGELLDALHLRPEIRRMARNPVMLTALAVVHWNEKRLPEQRAELYESIVKWLLRSREKHGNRLNEERAQALLQELALAMHLHPEGRQIQILKRDAAEAIAAEIAPDLNSRQAIVQAEQFLDREELDSGIIVGRGNEVRFWHLTFQEYLAARAIAARSEDEQQHLLLDDAQRLYRSEWREVALLMAGVLHQQGRKKLDGFVAATLAGLGEQPDLAAQARCAGLLGAIVRDLSPVDYVPADPRYDTMMQQVLGIFDRDRASSIPIETRLAAADALGQAGDPRIEFRRADYWATIPAGKFWMGAQSGNKRKRNYDDEAYTDPDWSEAPVHEVHLDEFRIAKYPVTVAQYEQFLASDGYADERFWRAGGFGEFTKPDDWDEQQPYGNRPVTGVSWYEAAAFCAWAGFRLPTEAEWERAARGADGRKFPWGKQPADESRLNFNGNVGHASPVGIYPRGATADGICDLAGNVWEWCADWFDGQYYARSTAANPTGPDEGKSRVLRGGAWLIDARYCRAANRRRIVPENRNVDVGFRVLCSRQNSP